MATVYEYMVHTDPVTSHHTVHLARQDDLARSHLGVPGSWGYQAPRALCGKAIIMDDFWVFGDESLSGIGATCAPCRDAVGNNS
jgi:hypothetical protein